MAADPGVLLCINRFLYNIQNEFQKLKLLMPFVKFQYLGNIRAWQINGINRINNTNRINNGLINQCKLGPGLIRINSRLIPINSGLIWINSGLIGILFLFINLLLIPLIRY